MEAKAPIAFDIVRKGIAPVVYSMQGDSNTRSIFISLFNDSIPWQVPADVSIAVAYKKPDGSKGLYDKLPNGKEAITVSGSSVKAIFAPQMLTVPGEVIASVVFFDKDINRLSTFPFIVMVTSDPSSGKQVSNDYYKFSTMEEVSKAVDDAIAALEADKQDFLAKAEEALEIVHGAATADAPAVVCETTGSVIAVNDSSERLLQGLTLYGKTTQNGTPTPENPVELVSVGESGAINTTVCGNNLFDKDNAETIGGYINSQGEPTGNAAIGTIWFVPVAENTKYTISTDSTAGFYYRAIRFLDSAKSVIGADVQYSNTYGTLFSGGIKNNYFNTATFTTPKGCTYVQVGSLKENWGSDSTIMLNYGDTALPYEPYKAQTLTASTPNGLPGIPVSSGGNYTDENGQQWICDEIDFARGVYVQRCLVGDSSKLKLHVEETNCNRYIGNIFSSPVLGTTEMSKGVSMCNFTNIASWNTIDAVHYFYSGNGANIWLPKTLDIETIKANIVFIGVLQTPIETALSDEELTAYAALHTNKSNTTVYNDAGAGLKLEYIADTKAYIDNKFTELQNAILSAGANI